MIPKKLLIVEIQGYRGVDTALLIEPPRKMYLVVCAKTGEVLDYGYRSYKEAKDAYNDRRYKIINNLVDLEKGE